MKFGILESTLNESDDDVIIGFVAPINIHSNQPVSISNSLSLKTSTSSHKVQRWELEANIEPSNTLPRFLTHSLKHGHTKPFLVRMPQVNITIPDLIFKLEKDVLAGSTKIQVSQEGIPMGAFINIGKYNQKVYLVIGVEDDIIEISPPINYDAKKLEVIHVGKDCVLRARYSDEVGLGIKYTDGILADPGTIKLIEAL